MNIEERIKEVFSDESFVKQLFEQETPEQVQALFKRSLVVSKDMEVKHGYRKNQRIICG